MFSPILFKIYSFVSNFELRSVFKLILLDHVLKSLVDWYTENDDFIGCAHWRGIQSSLISQPFLVKRNSFVAELIFPLYTLNVFQKKFIVNLSLIEQLESDSRSPRRFIRQIDYDGLNEETDFLSRNNFKLD